MGSCSSRDLGATLVPINAGGNNVGTNVSRVKAGINTIKDVKQAAQGDSVKPAAKGSIQEQEVKTDSIRPALEVRMVTPKWHTPAGR